MTKLLRLFGFLLLLAIAVGLPGAESRHVRGSTISQATIDSDYYTAGVVEFQSSGDTFDNLAGYLEIISSENASATDIIVFPEATLNGLSTTTFVPEPEQQVVPCSADPNATYYHELLVALSCASLTYRKYVVINVSEKQLCSQTPEDPRPCATNGLNVFNTNVVFDRSGAVVSRYRKVHLYNEPRNTTAVPDRSSFETDFGVTFGHIICFDILYYTPGLELIEEAGVRDFLFPSMWFGQLPFLSGVQFQNSWAYGADVNLLAAGSSRPAVGSSGTGIYHGKEGTLVSVMNKVNGERRIYVAQVPKFNVTARKYRRNFSSRVSSSDFYLKQDYLENYQTLEIELNSNVTSQETEICDGNFCCNFELEWRHLDDVPMGSSYYTYRLGARNGLRKLNSGEPDVPHLRNCALFACTGSNIEDCGKLLEEAVVQQPQVAFTRLRIEASYPTSKEFLLMPNTLRDDLLPLEPSQFVWKQSASVDSFYHKVEFALPESTEISNLLTFAIYGDYYDDVGTYTGGGSAIICATLPMISGLFLLALSLASR